MVRVFGGITLLTLIFGSKFIAGTRSLPLTPSTGQKLEQAAISRQSRHHVLTDREEANLQTLDEEG